MKIAYFDCIAGASGDMILGALIDAGLPLAELQAELFRLGLNSEFSLSAKKVSKNGFGATKVTVETLPHAHQHGRHLAEIEAIIGQSSLPGKTKDAASAVFRRLAQCEADIHGMDIGEVHLHEVGAIDAIVDIVGAIAGLGLLGIDRIIASPLPMGRGFISGEHGKIPLPAPAALSLLRGLPIRGVDIDGELVTPTGAAILSTQATSFGPIPTMTLNAVGYGAGTKDFPIPNLLRILVGTAPPSGPLNIEHLILLETQIDNASPEILGHVSERLFSTGALDVTLTHTQMKKNRPGALLSVLCHPEDAGDAEQLLFRETPTLGVRRSYVERASLDREIRTLETPLGKIRVKFAALPDGSTKFAPEYEDCKAVALSNNIPIHLAYQAAIEAAQTLGTKP